VAFITQACSTSFSNLPVLQGLWAGVTEVAVLRQRRWILECRTTMLRYVAWQLLLYHCCGFIEKHKVFVSFINKNPSLHKSYTDSISPWCHLSRDLLGFFNKIYGSILPRILQSPMQKRKFCIWLIYNLWLSQLKNNYFCLPNWII
jgi:hypothetical protein